MLPLRLSEIAKQVDGECRGGGDPEIRGLAALADAGPHDLGFVTDPSRLAEAEASGAGALLVAPGMEVAGPHVVVAEPYRVFARLLAHLDVAIDRAFPPGIHPTAVVDPGAEVDATAAIGPYCTVADGAAIGAGTRLGSHVVVGCDARIGADCVLHAQVVLRERCQLGDRVIVHAAAVVGADGFGYLPGPAGMEKIPQVGIVVVEDDVELGAGVTIDRATTGRTVIGAGSKVDNQVQIAHNVRIGHHCALSAQTGIAGSSVLGNGVICGGQVGIADHTTVGDGAQLGAQSGVIKDLAPGAKVFGTPAQDVKDAFRTIGAVRRLPALQGKVRELEQKLAALEERLAESGGSAAPDGEK